MQKQKRIILIFALAAAAVAAGLFYYSSPETKNVPYRTFYSEVAEGKIETAEISEDKIIFTFKNSGTDGATGLTGKERFSTENPHSASLKEYLLLNGVSVSEEKDAGEIIALIFDSIFYIIFFAEKNIM